MQLGIFAKTFPGHDPLAVLQAARAAGYDTVQYNMSCSGIGALPEQIPASSGPALTAAIDSTSVGIAAISVTYNMIHPDVGVRTAGRRAFRTIAELADALNVRVLTLCTGSRDAGNQWRHHPDNQTPDAWRDLTTEFGQILPIAEQFNLDVGIEPEHANVVNTAERAAKLINELGSPRIKIVLDPANLVEHADPAAWNGVVESSIDLLQGRIALAHAKDRNIDGSIAVAGKGGVDFDHFISTLKSSGFDGPVITHGLEADDAASVARYLRGLLPA